MNWCEVKFEIHLWIKTIYSLRVLNRNFRKLNVISPWLAAVIIMMYSLFNNILFNWYIAMNIYIRLKNEPPPCFPIWPTFWKCILKSLVNKVIENYFKIVNRYSWIFIYQKVLNNLDADNGKRNFVKMNICWNQNIHVVTKNQIKAIYVFICLVLRCW